MSGQQKTHTVQHELSERDFLAGGADRFGQVKWTGGLVEVEVTDVASREKFVLPLQPSRCELVRDDSLRAGNSRLEFTHSVRLPGANGTKCRCKVVLTSDGGGWMTQVVSLA